MGEDGERAIYLPRLCPGFQICCRGDWDDTKANRVSFYFVFQRLGAAVRYCYEALHNSLWLSSGMTQKQFSARLTRTV